MEIHLAYKTFQMLVSWFLGFCIIGLYFYEILCIKCKRASKSCSTMQYFQFKTPHTHPHPIPNIIFWIKKYMMHLYNFYFIIFINIICKKKIVHVNNNLYFITMKTWYFSYNWMEWNVSTCIDRNQVISFPLCNNYTLHNNEKLFRRYKV